METTRSSLVSTAQLQIMWHILLSFSVPMFFLRYKCLKRFQYLLYIFLFLHENIQTTLLKWMSYLSIWCCSSINTKSKPNYISTRADIKCHILFSKMSTLYWFCFLLFFGLSIGTNSVIDFTSQMCLNSRNIKKKNNFNTSCHRWKSQHDSTCCCRSTKHD